MKNYKFCPFCGHQDSLNQITETEYLCQNCNQTLWDNPRATVAVILANNKEELLFAKRGIEPNKGKYDFPGGFLEYGEGPYEACVRELHEELSINVDKSKLQIISAYTSEYLPGVSVTDLIVLASSWEGTIKAQDDVASAEWRPSSFINKRAFAPNYPGLVDKLRSFLN